MFAAITKLNETNAIMRELSEAGMNPGMDAATKMLSMRRALIGRGSISLVRSEIRKFHRALVKDYRQMLNEDAPAENYEEAKEA